MSIDICFLNYCTIGSIKILFFWPTSFELTKLLSTSMICCIIANESHIYLKGKNYFSIDFHIFNQFSSVSIDFIIYFQYVSVLGSGFKFKVHFSRMKILNIIEILYHSNGTIPENLFSLKINLVQSIEYNFIIFPFFQFFQTNFSSMNSIPWFIYNEEIAARSIFTDCFCH